MTSSQVERAVEAAWPTLTRWFEDQRDKASKASPLQQVMTVRSAAAMVPRLLCNAEVKDDDTLARQVGANAATTYTASVPFSRLGTKLELCGKSAAVDVLRQVAWGSERFEQKVRDGVDAAVDAETAFACRGLGVNANNLAGHDGLNARTLAACRQTLGGEHPFWVLVSREPPAVDAVAQAELKGGAVSRVPQAIVGSGQALVVALRPLDAVLLRGTDLELGWELDDGGVVLVLDQLLAVDVVKKPNAVRILLT